jgi:hypothetical protein
VSEGGRHWRVKGEAVVKPREAHGGLRPRPVRYRNKRRPGRVNNFTKEDVLARVAV